MKARKLIEGAYYGPDQLKALTEAFNAAWEQLAPRVGPRKAAADAARVKLANTLLKLAESGNKDAAYLTEAALNMVWDEPTEL